MRAQFKQPNKNVVEQLSALLLMWDKRGKLKIFEQRIQITNWQPCQNLQGFFQSTTHISILYHLL